MTEATVNLTEQLEDYENKHLRGMNAIKYYEIKLITKPADDAINSEK